MTTTISARPQTAGTSPREEPAPIALGTDPEIVLEQIRRHLEEGGYRIAQRLAKAAAHRFPGHQGLATMNRGLHGRRAHTRPANGHSRRDELAWLRHPPESVRGRLVALVGREMVASADTMAELMAILEPMNLAKMPLIHRVES